ncbi:MAG: thioredoxin, partial [Rhodospirillaceae bacterium]
APTGAVPAAPLDMGPGGPAGPAAAAPPPAGGGAVIKDSDTSNFMKDVIEASMQVPVIVDFWAPWCGPCKQLGPMLEKAVTQAGGLVRLVKVNVDENQELAAQLRVQSIPAVFAFQNGRPVDGFAGALPESQIKSFIDRLLGGAKPPLEQALEAAAEMLDAGQAEDALALYSQIQAEAPDSAAAIAGILRAHLALGNHESVDEIVAALPADLKTKSEVAAALSAVELAQAAETAGDVAPLRERVDAEPKNPEARYDLAIALIAGNQHEAAINELLELVRINRAWNEEAGRVQLIKVFDTLGPTHPLTVAGRKRLSSVLFS